MKNCITFQILTDISLLKKKTLVGLRSIQKEVAARFKD